MHYGYPFFDSNVFAEEVTDRHHENDQNQEEYTSKNCSYQNGICMWIAGARREEGDKELKMCNKCIHVQRDYHNGFGFIPCITHTL